MTLRKTILLASMLAAMVAVVRSGVARADSIDGHWCAPDGRHLTIAGMSIVTPGGTKMSGDYTRHSFAYVAPTGDPDAGAAINLRLLDEDTVRSVSSDPANPSAVWRRCRAETS
jgi:hypothetical protein